VIGDSCPLCGKPGCYRQIKSYARLAIEVEPGVEGEVREGRVPIARFLCRVRKLTFSLLPIQLLPYHRYTVATVVSLLLLAQAVLREEGSGLFSVAEQRLAGDARITGWELRCWLEVAVTGLRRGHQVLGRSYSLSQVLPGRDLQGRLDEVSAYFSAFAPRGPPGRAAEVHQVLARYGRATGRFLFGTPSQERGSRCVS